MRKGLVSCHACSRIDSQAAADKLAGGERDATPVFERGKRVVGFEDGLHLLEVGVTVEGRVATEEEIGYDTDGPDVAVACQRGLMCSLTKLCLHRLSVASLPENLRCHVTWGTTGGCEHMELLLVHDAGEAKISDEQISVVLRSTEQQILGLEIAMHNTVVVQIGDGGEGGSNQVGGIRLVVVALAADAIEQLAAEGKVRHQVDCSRYQLWGRVAHARQRRVRLFMVSK